MEPPQWICKRCGLSNNVKKKECRGGDCYEWRPRDMAPTLKRKHGDWNCCGEVQFASRKSCRKCGKDKPQEQGGEEFEKTFFKPGDWYCVKCNDHQFAIRRECRKCGAAKPIVGDFDGDLPCIICLANERNAGFLHGDEVHFTCCRQCATPLDKCPVCRQHIQTIVKVYI